MAESQEQSEQLNETETTPQAETTQPESTADQTPTADTAQTATETPQAPQMPSSPVSMPDLTQMAAEQLAQTDSSIDLLKDVELNVKIELGRAKMYVEDVLKLGEGSVVELDKLAGDPVDIFVNERLVAKGEVLVLNDNFCVRVNQIVANNI